MSRFLALATAALKPGQSADIDHRSYPRVDYLELQRILGMDFLNYAVYQRSALGRLFRYVDTRMRSDLYLAWLGVQAGRRYRLILAMSERAGIPYAGWARIAKQSAFVSTFKCWSRRQELAVKKLRLFKAMDAVIVHCTAMKQKLTELGADPGKIHVIPYSVDQRFFSPASSSVQEKDLVISLGEVRSRDYKSLLSATAGLPLRLVVAASGAWYAREYDPHFPTSIPANVTIENGLPPTELRSLYARAQFVVLPVYDVVFSAGATVALEAACMGKAIIANRSRGLAEYVIDGETGILVEPGDTKMLRDAIDYLLHHPEEAKRLGRNARQRVDEELNLDCYLRRTAEVLNDLLD